MALALGAQYRPAPEDERLAKSAANSANAVGAAGVSVAACAAAGTQDVCWFHVIFQPAFLLSQVAKRYGNGMKWKGI